MEAMPETRRSAPAKLVDLFAYATFRELWTAPDETLFAIVDHRVAASELSTTEFSFRDEALRVLIERGAIHFELEES